MPTLFPPRPGLRCLQARLHTLDAYSSWTLLVLLDRKFHSLSFTQCAEALSLDENEMYEILLEEQSFPFEEKAIEVYEANTGRVLNGVWDQWVVLSYEQLAILMPARYAKYEKADEHVAEMY